MRAITGPPTKLATYGLAALVAAGHSREDGIFKVILVALFAAKKLVTVGVLAILTAIKRFFGVRKEA